MPGGAVSGVAFVFSGGRKAKVHDGRWWAKFLLLVPVRPNSWYWLGLRCWVCLECGLGGGVVLTNGPTIAPFPKRGGGSGGRALVKGQFRFRVKGNDPN